MTGPQYYDNYEGRGEYAKQNHAMLDQEQLRLAAWQEESTVYKRSLMPSFALIGVLVLALAGTAAVYYLASGL